MVSVLASAIRDSARKVIQRREAADLVELTALLFAVARLLAGRFADASLEDQEALLEAKAFLSLEVGLEILAALPPGMDRETLYRHAIQGLQAVEANLESPRDRNLLSRPVTLPTVEHEDDVLISGRVRFWLRPRSELRELRRERRKASATSLPMAPRRYPESHLETLGAYWEANPQLPPCRPRNASGRELEDHSLVSDSGALAREGSFRIALCPLAGEFFPHFEIRGDGSRFCIHRPKPMAAQEKLQGHLELLLEAASEQRVDLLLLPELTVDSDSFDHVVERLAQRAAEHPRAIVPGSFHVWVDGERPFNETRLLDGLGGELLTHRKAGRFRITPEHVARSPHFFRHCPHVRSGGALADSIPEDIDRTASLEFLDTSLGRLAVLICADGIDLGPNTLYDVLRDLRPDLTLIVSMSFKTEPFDRLAEDLARLGIGSVMVNAACVCDGTEERQTVLALADLALPDLPGRPASRVRWRAGNDAVELYDRQNATWAPAEPGQDSATGWLAGGGQQLGLILDLGPHFQAKA